MSNVRLIIGSPIDYEELVIYINIDGQDIALVQKEEGAENLVIEFFEDLVKPKVYFADFVKALMEAQKELLK